MSNTSIWGGVWGQTWGNVWGSPLTFTQDHVNVHVLITEQEHLPPNSILCVPLVNGVVFLQWKCVDHDNVFKYNIYISRELDGNYKLISSTSNKMTYIKSLPVSTKLYFRVSARYIDGYETEKIQAKLGRPRLNEHNIRITSLVGTDIQKDTKFNFTVKKTGRSVQLSNIFDIEL